MNTDLISEFLLDVNNPKGLEDYLANNNYLNAGEKLEHLDVAGDGNMNMVLRAVTNHRSYILKQSLAWVHRFPMVKAPRERILTEYDFYQTVQKNAEIKKLTPEMYWLDRSNFLLCMEDLGQSQDFMHLYKKDGNLEKSEMADIARVVSELHFRFKFDPNDEGISNMEMRMLNHTHIFHFPLDNNNGFNLDSVLPGLQSATDKFRNDQKLKARALELGEIYLSDSGTRLLHGDYYPGSWLKTPNGFRMIDPEFCFKGPAEFELGVAVAHLKMAQQSESLLKDLFVYYHFDSKFDGSLFSNFAGMEMIRRILGLAQLPLELDLKERLELLDEAYELVING
ncbi:MAG TPA: aminoglycoside phosphotransferase [Flavobacteriales bacterium]|nr:aminoglycoside phosphotransferase [Flavobacteriales bacterium]